MVKRILLYTLALLSALSLAQTTTKESDVVYSQPQAGIAFEEKAEMWGISTEDYVRYTEIMEGPLKHWNPNVDPVMALGIFARTEAEKLRFAEIYAQQEYRLVGQAQAFERAYRAAFHRLYPDARMVTPELMSSYYEQQARKKGKPVIDFSTNTLLDGDRVLYFVDVDCNTCQEDITQLQSLVRKNRALYVDFYILNIKQEDEARRWASTHGIDVAFVKQSRITINIDDGVYRRLSKSSVQKTHFFLHRNGEVFAVSRQGIFLQ